MTSTDLQSEYERLRTELEAAYAAETWNSRHIDRIANAIARIERSCMRHPAGVELPLAVKVSAACEAGTGQV